jgi:hypothetical protein
VSKKDDQTNPPAALSPADAPSDTETTPASFARLLIGFSALQVRVFRLFTVLSWTELPCCHKSRFITYF